MSGERQQPARIAAYNRTVVLDLIRRFGPVSKSELAERSDLAPSSVLNIVSSLSRRGLVRSTTQGRSTGGRPPALIELDPTAHFALGVNIRISVVEAVLVDLVGDIVAETRLPLCDLVDPRSVAGTVVEAVSQLLQLSQVDQARILGLGVGCPGPVVDGRVVLAAPAFPGWRDVRLAELLELRLGIPVTLENDANLGALAEYRYGVGRSRPDLPSMVYVYADHGIGAGIVLDGKLHRGTDGLAGELGHVVIDVHGRQCICGNHGCLEALASVGAIVRRAAASARMNGSQGMAERVRGDWDALSFAAVLQAAEEGDSAAMAALDEALGYLAVAICNVSRQLRPDVLVLGGQLFDRAPIVYDRLLDLLSHRPVFYSAAMPPVIVGELGMDAPSLGAATVVLERFFGIAERVMRQEPRESGPIPSFEQEPVAHTRLGESIILTRSQAVIRWAGNLRPVSSRISEGEPLVVTVDVDLEPGFSVAKDNLKAVLRWDRVAVYGGNWASPKNSPMSVQSDDGTMARFGVSLEGLPPGKYEFAAHVLGANDRWVRTGEPGELNGRIEVLPRSVREVEQTGLPPLSPIKVGAEV